MAPDFNGDVDVDGYIVDNGLFGNGAIETNPYAADSVGEFIGVVWESAAAPGAETHIRGRFYDVIGGPDEFTPNAVNLSDGIGIESNAVIVSGGANSGWGIAWEELDSGGGDTTHTLRTNFMGPGQLTASEQDVWTEAATVDQHDIAMSRGILDRTLASPVGGSVLPVGMTKATTWPGSRPMPRSIRTG